MQGLRKVDVIMNELFRETREVARMTHVNMPCWYLHGRIDENDTWLVADLSPRRPGFLPRPVRVGFVVHKVEIKEGFLQDL
jgi:hypothetical protein